MDIEFSLISLFAEMPDPRLDRKRLHQLGDILTISILAVVCGAESWIDIEDFGIARYEWLKRFLELPNGIPSHDTFNRVFSLIDPKEFERRFAHWVRESPKRARAPVDCKCLSYRFKLGFSANGSGEKV